MRYRLIIALALSALAPACAHAPAERVAALAADWGMERRIVRGTDFEHVVYFNRPARRDTRLHVYLEGDGTPWIGEQRIAADPTPRNPLMLGLMALDASPSVYVGRPCYHGLADVPPCNPRMWTSARYSEAVVASLAQAVRHLIGTGAYTDVVLIGHSGGGSLAMLLAGRLAQTHAVVTLAANLDTDAWTALHRYSPLVDSLNPATRPPLAPAIVQLHLIGARDRQVPVESMRPVVAAQAHAELRIVEGFAHVCCWEELWPQLLAAPPLARTIEDSSRVSGAPISR